MKISNEPLGQGSYGKVYKAHIDNLGDVAVKRLFVHDQSDFTFSIREIELGIKFDHINLLKTKQIRTQPDKWRDQIPKGHRDDDLCLVFDLAKCDLYSMCDDEIIIETRCKNIIVQLLLAVEYLHNNGYIHRDIRPANILLFNRDRIKLCDYGFCEKYYKYSDSNPVVNAMYFRAPEILSSNTKYSFPSDVWSVGCVMHYLITKKILPVELEDDSNDEEPPSKTQLQSLIDGYPFEIEKGDPCAKGMKTTGRIKEKTFLELYGPKIANKQSYISFLSSILAFNQDKRLTATQALSHKYVSDYSRQMQITRENSVNIHDESKKYMVTFGQHREVLKGPCILMFKKLREEDWYTNKILFTGIEMFDRLLSLSSKIRELSYFNQCIYFRSCMYIAAKYYSSHYLCDLRLNKFPLKEYSPSSLEKARDFENTVLEILEYDIYRTTLLDEHTRERVVSTRTSVSLLLFVIEGKHKDLTPSEALFLWKEESESYTAKATELLKEILGK